MKKKLGIALAAIIAVNTVSCAVYAFKNPLKSYNLYEDTHPSNYDSSARETVVNDILPSANASVGSSLPEIPSYDSYNSSRNLSDKVKTRNQILRESSQKVYSNIEEEPAWTQGPVYYPEPSFDSIVAKYKNSDFAGCMQECVAYVRTYPDDTLGYYYLAMCYTKISDKDNAIRAYEKVIELNDNPMIVKYATNGRNCVMSESQEQCYENVNVPELIYPYADYVNANAGNLTPVDPETLVNRNLEALKAKLNPVQADDSNNNSNSKDDKDKKGITLPFGTQDKELDEFINSPYGNGLSPELNTQYKQIQLKKIQSTINNGEDTDEKEYNNMKNIKEFDNQKTDAGNIKLAYEPSVSEWEQIAKDPVYIQNKQDLEQLQLMFGTADKKGSDITDMLPYMTEENAKKLSPEAFQTMMLQSLTGNLSL